MEQQSAVLAGFKNSRILFVSGDLVSKFALQQ